MVSSMGKRDRPSKACKARSLRNQLAWAKRLAPASTAMRNAVKVAVGIDVVGRLQLDRHLLPKLLDKPQLVKEGYKNRNPAQRGHGTLRLAQNQTLIGKQGADLARD
jgi:hypothetical protein